MNKLPYKAIRIAGRLDQVTYDRLRKHCAENFTSISEFTHRAVKDSLDAFDMIQELGGAELIKRALEKRMKGED